MALDLFNRAAHTGHRLWVTLGNTGPWRVPAAGLRQSRVHKNRAAAFDALLDYMFDPIVAGQAKVLTVKSPPLPWLYRALRDFLLRRRGGARVIVLAGAAKKLLGLLDAVAATPVGARRILAVGAEGSWKDYARLAREYGRAFGAKRQVSVALAPGSTKPATEVAERLIGAISDRAIVAAFGRYRALLASRLGSAGALLHDGGRIVTACRPQHYVSAEISRQTEWALAEACGRAGVLRWVAGRNSHAPPAHRVEIDAVSGYYLSRYPTGLVDRHVVWSPNAMAAARSILPRSRWPEIRAIKAMPVSPPEHPAGGNGRPRQILVADSFSTLWFPHNWVYQTSHEFLAGLSGLIEVVEHTPGANLIVRVKNKHELDVECYDVLLPRSDRITIKVRDVPMRIDLLASTVLVAFRSTTIEEALHMRRPVLLWGGTARYRYLPARRVPPTRTDRAAVYAANSVAELKRLLPAILDAHEGSALTDAEIAAHVWDGGVADVAEFALQFASVEPSMPSIQASSADRLHAQDVSGRRTARG